MTKKVTKKPALNTDSKKLYYEASAEIGQQVEAFFAKSPKLKTNVHALGFRNFFTSKVNLHINWTNFKLIDEYFSNQRGSALNILDLGSGFGDKAIIIRKFFPRANVVGVEAVEVDDPHMKESPPHKIFEKFYPFFRNIFKIDLRFYDGINLDFPDHSFDIIVLYAVIEHVDPRKRKRFIKEISKKLKPGGHIVITRCPRKYSLTEFMARSLKLAHHPWLLTKQQLLSVFGEKEFEVRVIKSLSNVPSNPSYLTNKVAPILVGLDHLLARVHWPFSSDYFLIVRKR